ncbi:GIP [Symbiodinium sp. CCMP2592]|nr:GIP [Symbiodinium sp. CCMP2592]
MEIVNELLYYKDYSQEADKVNVDLKESDYDEEDQDLQDQQGQEKQPKKEEVKPKEGKSERKSDPQQEQSSQGKGVYKPEDITEFTELGFVWHYNKKTQEYRVHRTDQKGSKPMNNTPVKGKKLWQKVCEVYRTCHVWFSDADEMEQYLKKKEDDRIRETVEQQVQERLDQERQEQQSKGKDPYAAKGWDSWSWDAGWANDAWNWDSQWEDSQWQDWQWQGKGKSKDKKGKGPPSWTQ